MSFDTGRLFGINEQHSVPGARVAVVVKLTPNGTHSGIFFVDEVNDCRVLHLGWHFDLRCNSFANSSDWFAVIPDLLPEKLMVIAQMCKLWCKTSPRVAYALRHMPKTHIEESGKLMLDDHQHGLTCASFAMVMLKRSGIEILDVANWPSRESDRPFQLHVLKMMRDNGAPQGHIELIESEVGCPRFRPEEVAGSCMYQYSNFPVSQTKCEVAAAYVLEQLHACRKLQIVIPASQVRTEPSIGASPHP